MSQLTLYNAPIRATQRLQFSFSSALTGRFTAQGSPVSAFGQESAIGKPPFFPES